MGLQSVILDDFSGGLDTSDPSLVRSRGDKTSPNCTNVTIPDNGKMIGQRGGFREYNFIRFPNFAIRNIFNWRFTASGVKTEKTYYSVNGAIYASNRNSSAPTLIFTGTAGTVWTFTPVVDVSDTDRLMLLNGVDPPQIISSGAPTTVGAIGGTNPQSKVAKVWKNFAVCAGDPAHTRRLYFSAIGNPLNWTTATDFIDVRSSDDDDTDPIVDLYVSGDNLFIFKPNSIWRLTKGPPSPEVIRVANVGTPNPRCIASLDNKIYFWGGHPTGIWSIESRTDSLLIPAKYESGHISAYLIGSGFSGGQLADIGQAGTSGLALLSNVFACRWGRRIYFSIQQDPADDSNGVIILEMLPDSAYKPDRNTPPRIPIFPHNSRTIQPNSMCAVTDPTTGEEILLGGSWGKSICRLFSTLNNQDVDKFGTVWKVDSYWEPCWIGISEEEKKERLRRVNILMSGTLATAMATDFSHPIVWNNTTVLTQASGFGLNRFRPESHGRYHKFQLRALDAGGSTWSVKSVELMYRGGKEH